MNFEIGGYQLGSNASRTTELFTNGDETHVNGPDLPIPRRSHCSVRVDPGNDFWILGGSIGEYENANYSGVVTGGNFAPIITR